MEPRLGHAAILLRLLALGAAAAVVLPLALAVASLAGCLLLALVFAFVPSRDGRQEVLRLHITRVRAASVRDAAGYFRERHHRWPELYELRLPAADGTPLLEAGETYDAWGQEFSLSVIAGRLEVRSRGEDGVDGTEDDVLATR